ncbi:hypothetical protein DCCM_4608 [Desulfocucumis palustris]|uniref:Uncharacterized protein n=1 Tax=Desulfocucumis palustris TaxID=1898651 RepID=A0A2L2XGI7_9FIRM|nr:hypothetical protein DCCM_4608 [Desulfocucumis palustris]
MHLRPVLSLPLRQAGSGVKQCNKKFVIIIPILVFLCNNFICFHREIL